MLIIIVLLLSYLLGSISFSLIIGKLFYKLDLREHGSGNLGSTNALRTFGIKGGLVVTVLDILKGTLAASLPLLLSVDIHPLTAGAAVIFGHCYSVFAKFKGGKAVATSAGVLLFYSPIVFLAAIICFFVVLKISKMVSLSSMVSAIIAFAASFFYQDLALSAVLLVLSLFIIFKHRSNIKRIINKTEAKVSWI